MRLHRLLGIIMLLDSRGTMKAGNLAKILETSERTIYRDIDILCEAGIPISSISGPTGGYSFMEGYKLSSNVLESQDVVNLFLSSMGIRPEKDTQAAYQLKNALIKLENSVSEEHKAEILRAKERFFMDLEPWWGKRVQNKYLDLIQKSILHFKKIKVYYKKYTGDLSERILRPYGVVVKNSEWYVVAFCEAKNEVRVFKCSRIEQLEVLDEVFIIPENFYLEEFWDTNKQVFMRQSPIKSSHHSYPVKTKCLEENKQLLEGFDIYASAQLGNMWLYAIDMLSFKTACSVIFPLSDRIEVLEPLELREYIIKKTNKILNLHKII